MDNIKHYILFPSYNTGLALEGLLKKEKIKYTIVPTPRELSTCCGISIQYNKADEERISEIVKVNSIDIIGFYSLQKEYKDLYLGQNKE